MSIFLARPLAAILFLGLSIPAGAAPFTPAGDSEVVERLPSGSNDPAVRRVDSLRKQLAAQPNDTQLRLEIARRYFDLAMAQGDPRYVGYASAAIAPMAAAASNDAAYWLVRGMIQQYSHDFTGALQSLGDICYLIVEKFLSKLFRRTLGGLRNDQVRQRLQPFFTCYHGARPALLFIGSV